jgi:folate-binding Fe-S cluster repair protein YgfZ
MNYFKRLFNKNKTFIQCPRCLGKGHVDMDDIKRLGKELSWMPDRCAYCNGTGEVESNMVTKVAVDEAYLTTDLSHSERKRVIDGNREAIERMKIFNMNIDHTIQDITTLHFVRKLDAEQIAEFYLESAPELSPEEYTKEKNELIEYINKVIAHKK